MASATFVLRHPGTTAPEGRPPGSPHGSERTDVEPTADAASRPEGVAVARRPEPAALDRRAWLLFALLLVGVTLGMTSHNLINTFLFQIVGSHGGDAAVLGLAAMIAAMVELPTMVFFERLLSRWTPGTLLVVGGVTFSAGSVFGALIGGVVLDAAGVPTLLLVGTVVAAAGAVLVWVGADRR